MENGVRIVSGGTDNHLMLLDLNAFNLTGKELEHMLDEVNITVNKNTIPFETQSPFVTSGIRIGTPSVTTRGMKETEMLRIADDITAIIKEREGAMPRVKADVAELLKAFPLYRDDIA